MKKVRKLKLPDGGSFDLAIPEGFGEPMIEGVPLSRNLWILAAAVGATLTVVAVVKAFGAK